MDERIKPTAHYHLPGLFEFYEFYRVFLPLFYEHREWFYDWCDIGSIYGAPADCLWDGGRTGYGDDDPRAVLSLLREYGISARLTFSNSLLREEHLSDKKCTGLCALFNESETPRNGVIVHSELLLDYLRRRYPKLYFVSSTTKVLTDFEEVYAVYFDDVYRYLLSLSGSESVAEELTSETFFRAMDALGRFRGECSVRVWLCQIAKNLYYSHLRREKRLVPLEDCRIAEECHEESLEDRSEAERIQTLLHALREPYKEVFMWRVYGEKSFRDIGALFGKTENWACVTYHRARRMIREGLED